MPPAPDALITAIHQSPRRGVFAVTGGGAGLLSSLLGVAGASATVLEAHVPYAARSLRDWLGSQPVQACSDETARALAMRAFTRALELDGDFGFAITASLRTTRPKRGAHRAHLAFQDASNTRTWTVVFDKRGGSRGEEECAVTEAAVQTLAQGLGVGVATDLAGTHARGDGRLGELMLGTRAHVGGERFGAVLPGAFNPLHDGHRGMRADASRRLGCPVGYELSITNVDKLPLDYRELNARLAQSDQGDFVVTNAPTFVDKARALGAVVFVVGTDTMERIAAPRYYGGVAQRDAAIGELSARGGTFLVYGRVAPSGFRTLEELRMPAALVALCTGVPESEFRKDLSSTELREAMAP